MEERKLDLRLDELSDDAIRKLFKLRRLADLIEGKPREEEADLSGLFTLLNELNRKEKEVLDNELKRIKRREEGESRIPHVHYIYSPPPPGYKKIRVIRSPKLLYSLARRVFAHMKKETYVSPYISTVLGKEYLNYKPFIPRQFPDEKLPRSISR